MLPAHTYEEIREIVISILKGRISPGHGGMTYRPNQYGMLVDAVTKHIREQTPRSRAPQMFFSSDDNDLDRQDGEYVRDVFWDLFRQGYITLGIDNTNANYPFFKLSHFGAKSLEMSSPYSFHDPSSFIRLVKDRVPDLAEVSERYLGEAVSTFYAGCLLASCVMLGAAAEAEFLKMVEIARHSTEHSALFSGLGKPEAIRSKIMKFRNALHPILPRLTPRSDFEDIDVNLDALQSVIRIARNEAGHPSGSETPSREQTYVYLQLFIPFAMQTHRLRRALA